MIETSFPLKTPSTIEAIKNWWKVFGENENLINEKFSDFKKSDFDVAEFMHAHFAKINPDLCWEFSKGESKSHVLAIAPERNRDMEPLSRLILASAPEFEHFEFRVNRDFISWESYQGYSDGRLDWNGPDGIMFTPVLSDHNMIDLVFYVHKTIKSPSNLNDNCFVAAESLLGEEVMAKWIQYFDVEPMPKPGLFSRKTKIDNLLPLSKLRETVASHIANIKNSLPNEPLFLTSENAQWSLLQMESNIEEDCEPMGDMVTAITVDVDLFQAFYSGRKRFYSDRFSACSESFIFVQLYGSGNDVDLEVFKDRGEIEDALNKTLNKEALGGVIGGSTGQRYSYIFLAVTDLDKSIALIRNTLQKGKITRRCWIMFNDTHREQEWIGVWDDTPAPKLPEIDSANRS